MYTCKQYSGMLKRYWGRKKWESWTKNNNTKQILSLTLLKIVLKYFSINSNHSIFILNNFLNINNKI
jgi:hypothetical protein